MATFDIDDIDLTPYQVTPLLPAEATVTLGLDLWELKPADAPAQVEKAGKRMLESAKAIEEVFDIRVEQAGINLRMQVSFDGASDRFWVATRHRLFYWMSYAHEGLGMLDDAEQDEIDLQDKLEKAEIARDLEKHLFGIDGLKFLSKPFNQQVALTASRLRFINGSDKLSDYEELLGTDLLTTLKVLQRRYEAMVRERSSKDDDSSKLKLLRFKLQRHIAFYASAVLQMIDEDDPKSIELVLAALRPMINARVGGKSSSSAESKNAGEPESEGEPVPAELLEEAPTTEEETDDTP